MSGHGHSDGHDHPGEADSLAFAVLTVSTSRAKGDTKQDAGADEHRGADTQDAGADEHRGADTQDAESPDDPGGDTLAAELEGDGHRVVERELVADDFAAIRTAVEGFCDDAAVDAVVTTGGTGVAPDDVTVDAVAELFDTELPGFGEAFRRESYDDIGPRAMGSRATGGLVDSTPVFCLPGSVGAVELGAELVVGVAPHLVEVAA